MREGQIVIYTPKNEIGVVSSIRDEVVFVKFKKGDTSSGCRMSDLAETGYYIGSIAIMKSYSANIKLVGLKGDGRNLLFEVIDSALYSGWSRDHDVPPSYVQQYTDTYVFCSLDEATLIRQPKNEYEKELISLIEDMKRISDEIKD